MLNSRKKGNTKSNAIAEAKMRDYASKTQEDMQETIKDVSAPLFEAMLQGEMDSHLRYESNNRSTKTNSDTKNCRNGYNYKNIKISNILSIKNKKMKKN